VNWSERRVIRTEADLAVLLTRVGAACRHAQITDRESARALTVISELGRNILKYAGRGHIEVALHLAPPRRIDIEALDTGPGIADVQAALRDHFSTGGTLGLGLPGVKRLVDHLEILSTPGEGTVVKARRWLP
jgi:anti-sigma regulatory factor (Ser/Thr protein kinase)